VGSWPCREQLRGCPHSLHMQEVCRRELSPGFLALLRAKNLGREGNTFHRTITTLPCLPSCERPHSYMDDASVPMWIMPPCILLSHYFHYAASSSLLNDSSSQIISHSWGHPGQFAQITRIHLLSLRTPHESKRKVLKTGHNFRDVLLLRGHLRNCGV